MENRGHAAPGIRAFPLAIIALLLIVPFLNLEFTFYRMTLKLLVFQTAVTLLWCALGIQWVSGPRRALGWPAWWLVAPLAAWVVWGALTRLWSPQPGLAAGWVVQGAYGLAGAVGLSLLLREREAREMTVKAAGAVAFVLALWMVVAFEYRAAGFFGDRDLVGRDVGAAFLLIPTLVAAAVLYGSRRADDEERDYRTVLSTAALLVVLLAAGLRASVAAWLTGLGIGVAVVVWLLLPRWRILAPLVAALVVVVAAQREATQAQWTQGEFVDTYAARQARLDRADRQLWRSQPLLQRLAGSGVGTFFVAYDHSRPLDTFAALRGDGLIDHARRQVSEVLFERGIVGVLLALAAGAACVAAGVMCSRRARDELDSVLGAGLGAGVLALGVFACASNGAIGFGASMMFWIGVGVLGSLTALYGREAGLGHSTEEEAYRTERRPTRRGGRLAVCVGGGVVAVVLWFAVGAQPFLAEVRLREGVEEHTALTALIKQYKRLIERRDEFSPNELRYLALRREARTRPAAAAEAEALAQKLPRKLVERLEAFIESVQVGRIGLLESARRTREQFLQAARLSLGDRVWLTAQVNLLRYAIDRFAMDARNREEVLGIAERVEGSCGPLFTLDVEVARFQLATGQFDDAHRRFRRYARKNPFAATDALKRSNTDVYRYWAMMIAIRHQAGDPRAVAWAQDFEDAARRGIRFDGSRYALLMHWGKLLYQLGRTEEAYTHMYRALDVIEGQLAYRRPRMMQADLLLDAAAAALPWDPEMALGLAGQVFMIGIDPAKPENARLVQRALAIIRVVGPPPPPRRRSRPANLPTMRPKGGAAGADADAQAP